MRLFLLLLTFLPLKGFSQSAVDSEQVKMAAITATLDSIDKTIQYQQGEVKLNESATLRVPAGYKFIPDSTTHWIVEELWRNPKNNTLLGMLVKQDYHLSDVNAWAFIVTGDESGHVKDDDAEDLDYDDLLKEIQNGEAEVNKERTAAGYPTIHLVGWASKPYYDKENKVLHWAKKLQFDGGTDYTLNYDVRILGRKSMIILNAVGTMDQLPDIQQHIPDIIHSVKFNDGHRYIDFDPKVDQIAAYTIGGLIAGKLLAKVGLLALLLKNIKLILLAIFGVFGTARKKIARWFSPRKEEPKTYAYESPEETSTTTEEHTVEGDSPEPDDQPKNPVT